MDEGQSLDALANLLNELADKPYDVSLHAQHIRLARSLQGLESELQSALEMMPEFLAAGEDIWLALIRDKASSVDLATSNGVGELLALYARAEADYLSIPVLQNHLQFLLERHAVYSGEEEKPAELGPIFSTEWTREAMNDVVNRGIGHLTQSHLLWDTQRDWELEVLEAAPKNAKEALAEHVQLFHLNRLRQPHSNSDETFQSYSSFTTNYKPPQDYEPLLVAASKIRSQGVKSFERRESLENALVQTNSSLETYARYLATERRARYADLFVMGAAYERAIAEAAKRRFDGELGAEEALRSFWVGYCDCLRINDAGETTELETLKRAVRSVPGSGEVWSRYIRYLERVADSDAAPGRRESVSETYVRSFGTKLLQPDVEQIVPVILARAGYEKRRIETDEDALATLIGVLESGIEMVRQASKIGDPRLRLEKYLTEVYIQITGLPDSAISVWQLAAKHYKSSYLVWMSYTDALIRHNRHEQARNVFKDIHTKNLDWPEAIWEAWLSFEHLYGSVDDVESCLDKVEKAQYQVNSRRAREAEKASYGMTQMVVEQQTVNASAAEVPIVVASAADMSMDIDTPRGERGTKRMAEDTPSGDGHKKAKIEAPPPPLKRDRENCTVFVADLPTGVTDSDLKGLFKDCGNVRETKITQLSDTLVATVEFFERDSIPPALTKDKKRLHDHEVAVHLAWKSTLYVTNFPESADDTFMRDLFGKFGTIFDIRWPSKKFKNTRRFCYVQYASPSSAQNALELHGRELEPNQPMSVLVSNPERKKERTDQDANNREVYVAGLSKFTTKTDLEKLFKTYGSLKEVRMATDNDGHSKGFAFVEFEEEKDAQAALEANNHELKKRRIAVTLADSRVRARNRHVVSDTGLGQLAETKSRSVRISNLPAATQEGLLQQVLEKIAFVKRVEVFVEKREAVVELENAAEVGKLLLRTEPLIFNGNTLHLSEEGHGGVPARPSAPPAKVGGLFVPRRAALSRPRAGLGHSRKPGPQPSSSGTGQTPSSQVQGGKGQDDFRKMLG